MSERKIPDWLMLDPEGKEDLILNYYFGLRVLSVSPKEAMAYKGLPSSREYYHDIVLVCVWFPFDCCPLGVLV